MTIDQETRERFFIPVCNGKYSDIETILKAKDFLQKKNISSILISTGRSFKDSIYLFREWVDSDNKTIQATGEGSSNYPMLDKAGAREHFKCHQQYFNGCRII